MKKASGNGEASTRSLSRPSADAALTWAAALERVGEETLKTYKGLQFSGINLPAPIEINLPAPIEYVASLMGTLTQLESLNLSGCSLGFMGAEIQTLSDALRTCRLVHLDLSDNLYSQEEAVPLIESLPSTITTLALDYWVKSLDSRVEDPCKLCKALELSKGHVAKAIVPPQQFRRLVLSLRLV